MKKTPNMQQRSVKYAATTRQLCGKHASIMRQNGIKYAATKSQICNNHASTVQETTVYNAAKWRQVCRHHASIMWQTQFKKTKKIAAKLAAPSRQTTSTVTSNLQHYCVKQQPAHVKKETCFCQICSKLASKTQYGCVNY
jgi:hypothetical protein